MRRVFLVVTIDCECDKGPAWRTRVPLAFDGVRDGIGARLQPLFERRRAKPTYLLSPEVIADDASAELLRRLADEERAELGTHLHAEFAEPGSFVPEVTAAFQRDLPKDIEAAKLATLTDVFRSAFGRRPRGFRAGRFGIGAESLSSLAALGYDVDTSVTPFMDWSDVGAKGLDFKGAPTQPYRPDARAPKRRGASPLVEIPVTIRRRLSPFPHAWLRPTKGSARALTSLAAAAVRDAKDASDAPSDARAPIVLNCMFHNVEVVPGKSPYAANEAGADAILARLDALLAWADDAGIRTIGLAEAADAVAPYLPAPRPS